MRPTASSSPPHRALIAEAIGKELGKHLGMVAKTAKAAVIEHVGLGNWLKVDPAKIGKTDGLTLAEAVRALRETSEKAVALIIDEAQHALSSLQGQSAMIALKSARDQLNTPDAANLCSSCPAPTGISCYGFSTRMPRPFSVRPSR